MERRRTFIVCFAFFWYLTACQLIEGRSIFKRTMEHDFNEENLSFQQHSSQQFQRRSLSAAYNLERCRWMQGSFCQINPDYARVLLSSSNVNRNEKIMDAILDEASCLSMTHEAACISQNRCAWANRNIGSQGTIQNHCQYKGSRSLWRQCSNESLQKLVVEYTSCRKQEGGSCNSENHCHEVKLSESKEGCGLEANRVLDLILKTPASQTEAISILIDSIKDLKDSKIPSLESVLGVSDESSIEENSGRKLLNDDAVDDILAVDDGVAGTSSSTKSVISGTGSTQSESYGEYSESGEQPSTETPTSNRDAAQANESSNNSTVGEDIDPSESPVVDKSEGTNNATIIGSLSFTVFPNANTSTGQNSQGTQEFSTNPDDIRTQINTPLELAADSKNFSSIDISLPVNLNDIKSVLTILTDVVEKKRRAKNANNLFQRASDLLDVMRFRLDSRMDTQTSDATWTESDRQWWKLQQVIESLDNLSFEDSEREHTLNANTELLVESCEIAKDTWRQSKKSREFKQVTSLERRLKRTLPAKPVTENEAESTSEQSQPFGSFDELIARVVSSFNRTLFSLYPSSLNITFAQKYKQTWVELVGKRNQRWRNIKMLISQENSLGMPIKRMLQKLYAVDLTRNTSREQTTTLPELQQLTSLVDDMVSAVVASRSEKYTIKNLGKEMFSEGIRLWQKGPQITIDMLKEVAVKDAKNHPRSAIGIDSVSVKTLDSVTKHLDAVIKLIETKLEKPEQSQTPRFPSESTPEATAIVLTVDTSLSLVSKWNNYASRHNLSVYHIEDLFGGQIMTNLSLSLAACLVLGPDEKGDCQKLDKTTCETIGLYNWSISEGRGNNKSHARHICAPQGTNQTVARLLQKLLEEPAESLTIPITDLFYITAYCPTLSGDECREDERCALYSRIDEERCRPSSNIVNYIVEEHQIVNSAAREESCRSYFGLPVCSDFQTLDVCMMHDGCVWTNTSEGEFSKESEHRGTCRTEWVRQLSQLNLTIVESNALFNEDASECQKQTTEEECVSHERQEVDANPGSSSTLPRESWFADSSWVVYCLTVLVTILFLMVVCISCKIYKNRNNVATMLRSSKKGKPRKKGEQSPGAAMKIPPFPMLSHVLEFSPCQSPCQKKKTAFPYGINAFENAETSSQSSRLRVPSQQDGRMDRLTSATTAEISDIQRVSEVEEITPATPSSVRESIETDEEWSSTDRWSDDSDDEHVFHTSITPSMNPASSSTHI